MSFTRQSPYETTPQDRFMGAILVLTIVIGIYSFSQGSFLGSLTAKQIRGYTMMTQSYGIMSGAEIKLSGIVVGYVEKVSLQQADKVKVEVMFKPKFNELISEDSQLKVNSSLGLDTVITGTGLELVPGKSKQQLKSGELLNAIEPQSLDDMLDQWNVKALATKIEEIVDKFAIITSTLADNQHQVVATMNNIADLTATTNTVISSLPPVINDINLLVNQLNSTVASLETNTQTLTPQISELLLNTQNLTNNLNKMIYEFQPTVERLPSTISQINRLSRSSNTLIQNLNHHWLIGGQNHQEINTDVLRHIGDDKIYSK